MAIQVGVMGSATEQLTRKQKRLALELGHAIAENHCILITGGCPGLPHLTAKGAKQSNGLTIGISPGLSLHEHVIKYDSPTKYYDIFIFTGSGLMGREVLNIRSSNIVIILGGRSGTLGEFAIAYDEGKLIGILEGSGGISDEIDDILRICAIKKTGAKIIKDRDPHQLVKKLLRAYKKEFHSHSSIFDHEKKIRKKWR